MKQFKDNLDINYTTFGKWLIYYYQAWSEKESACILREFNDFHLENIHLIIIHISNLMVIFGDIGVMQKILQIN